MINGITGARYARNCHPNDLWTTYFTSSKFVKAMAEKHGKPDVIEIRRTFSSSKKTRMWEKKVIRRIGAVKSKRWLNLANGGSNLTAELRSNTVKSNMSKAQRKGYLKKLGFEDYEEFKYFIFYCLNDGMSPNKIKQTYGFDGYQFQDVINEVDCEFIKELFKRAYKGNAKTIEHRQNISKSRMGVKFSDEHKDNLKASLSKVIDKRTRTKLDNYWKSKGFDSNNDAIKTMRAMYASGMPIYKIAEELKVDPITVSKKVKRHDI